MKIKCDECGAEFNTFPSYVKRRKHHFCDNTCQGKFFKKYPPNKGYTNTTEKNLKG